MHLIGLLLFVPAICSAWQPPPSNCAADGLVVNSVTGQPVPRAHIVVLSNRTGTVADGSGRWSMSDVPCGPLRLSASKNGFFSAPITTKDSPAHDMRVELVPQAVVTGKVLDEAGDPVQNTRIVVMSSRVSEGRRAFVQGPVTMTNDLGEYRIASLAAEKVIVCATPPENGQLMDFIDASMLAESCYPGPVEGGAASAMPLFAGREARADFNLTRVPVTRIRGKLAGMPEGVGVAVALVKPGAIGNTAKVSNMAKDGSFEIRGVPSGSWILSVDYWENGKRLLARTPVQVGGSDVEGVVVHVEPGVTVTGTVPALTKQINVSLRGSDRTMGAGAPQWDKARTTFTITDVIPGSYLLNVNVPAPYYVKGAMLGGHDMIRETMPILQSTGPIQVLIGDDSGSVQGQVQDGNGDGAAGWVMLWREGRPQVMAPAGPDGRFKMTGVPPGDYTVYAWDDIQQVEYADADWMRRHAGSGVPVTVSAGQSAEVKLTRVVAPRE